MQIAIVGSGPAALMAATQAARQGHHALLFEKKRGPGRKLLVAGSSGLNVTYEGSAAELAAHYRDAGSRFEGLLARFGPADWLAFVHGLGLKTFCGTSRRHFVEGMKASTLLRAWLKLLASLGATISFGRELVDFECAPGGHVTLSFADGSRTEADAAVLALGGASWEKDEAPLRWPALFERKAIAFVPFRASNVGYRVSWPEGLLAEAEGKPLKNIALTTARGTKRGDLVITRYGLEGTPIYFLGAPGPASLDLKPDLTVEQLAARLKAPRENLSPLKRVKKQLALGPASFALVAHLIRSDEPADPDRLAAWLKRIPLMLEGPQPIEEAISSSGGVSWDELDENLMLRRYPGVFCAGEMIAWDAPTGGFLIQGCVSQGYVAGEAAGRWSRKATEQDRD